MFIFGCRGLWWRYFFIVDRPPVRPAFCANRRLSPSHPTPTTTTAVCKLAKNGMTPSQIGVILRDSHGIAQVKTVTGQKILRLLKRNGACCLIDD